MAQSSGILYPYLSAANDVNITRKNKLYFYCYAFSWNLYKKSTKNNNDFGFCSWATHFYINIYFSEFNSINSNYLTAFLFNSFSTFTIKIARINQKHLQSKIIPNKYIKNCAKTYNFREKFVVVLPLHQSNILFLTIKIALTFSHATSAHKLFFLFFTLSWNCKWIPSEKLSFLSVPCFFFLLPYFNHAPCMWILPCA